MMISGFILAAALATASPDTGGLAHSGQLNVTCIECHTHLPFPGSAPTLRDTACDACGACHIQHHGTDAMRAHPVQVAPSMRVPSDMPLDKQGNMQCITCHAFHGDYRDENGRKLFYLKRSPGKTFCYSCHQTLPGASGRQK
jgi:hypothetical protein